MEVPSNEIFRRVGSMWLAFLVIVFGVVSIATAFVHNLAGVIVTRIFLGLSEGGRKSTLVASAALFQANRYAFDNLSASRNRLSPLPILQETGTYRSYRLLLGSISCFIRCIWRTFGYGVPESEGSWSY